MVGFEPQPVVGLDVEGSVEGVDVADDLVAAELRRGVGVDRQAAHGLGRTHLGLPRLRPGVEEALVGGEAVDRLGSRRAVEREAQRLVGDAEPAEVADVLADRQRAVDGVGVAALGGELVVLVDEDRGEGVEGGPVVIGPPVDHRPGAVVLRALVVEAVADLVADDGADRAVVDRVVGVGMEERRLEDGRREHDLVHRGVVVRVDRLRGHVPLVAVDGGADLGQLAVHGDGERAARVAEQVGRVGLEGGVVLELLGVADLRGERGELLQRPLLGGVAHPRERADALAVGRDEVVDQLAHALLGGGRELGADVDLADRLAHRALDEPDAALPARAQLVGAAERASVELEVGVDERGRQVRRAAVHDVPAQPVAPRRQLVVDEQVGEALQERRLGHDDLGHRGRGDPGGRGPGGEVEARRERLQLGGVDEVVGLLGVAAGHPVPVVGRDAGLEVHHALRPLGRLVEAGQLEHGGDVVDVRLADGGEVVVGVVRLVGQAEAVLGEVRDVAVGLPAVGRDEQAEDAADAHPLERAEGAHERRDVGDRLDLAELVGQRLRAERLDALLVHEAGVEVADLAFLAVPGRRPGWSRQLSTIDRTFFSASSNSVMKAPAVARSAGMSVVRSHGPLTCRNRSSWTRMSGSSPRDVDGGLRGRGIG